MKVTWKKVINFQQLTALQTQWASLNQHSNDDCLFTSPIWLLNWYRTFWQKNWQLHCFAVFNDDTLIGLFPFYYQKNSSLFTQRELFLLGQGEEEKAEIASEYLDILIDKTMKEEVIKNCLFKLQLKSFDLFNVRAVKHDANIIQLLDEHKVVTGYQYCLDKIQWRLIDLSKNNKKRYKRSKNQLANMSGEFSWVSSEEFATYWEVMKDFHQRRWQNKTQLGAFDDATFNQFHQHLFNAKIHTSIPVKMSRLTIDGNIVAINYYLLSNDTLHFYQSGWDEKRYSQLSPGFALHLWSIENSLENKYDFMLGSTNDSYKARFNTDTNTLYNISINFRPIKHLFFLLFRKIFPVEI